MRINLPYLIKDRDERGNVRYYVRRSRRKIRIREEPGTAAFNSAYHAALEQIEQQEYLGPGNRPRIAPGTVEWLAQIYYASREFRDMSRLWQRAKRGVIESCLAEPIAPGSKDLIGKCPVKYFTAKHVRMLRDRKEGSPGAANNRIKALSSMFGWAAEAEHVESNPARGVRRISYASDGFHTWTQEEIEQFEKHWPIGSKPRLAYALMFYTGARRGDAIRFGRQHIKDGWLRFVPNKTKHKKRDLVEIPVAPKLADIIAATPTGDLTLLIADKGKQPFTDAGFGNWFRDMCREAGLASCTSHGLRKARATILAENGATDRQLMAWFNWSNPEQASVYTRAANKRQMTQDAAQLATAKERSRNG